MNSYNVSETNFVRLRRQLSLTNLTTLGEREMHKRKYYSFCMSNYHGTMTIPLVSFLVKNLELEWDDTNDLIELTESETWSNYDFEEYMPEFSFYDIDLTQEEHSISHSSLQSICSFSDLKKQNLVSYDYLKNYYQLLEQSDILKNEYYKSKSLTNLTKKKYLCLKSKHFSLLNLNLNIKYCLNKKKQKKKSFEIDKNTRFFRLSKINLILVYFERFIDKFKSIIYKSSNYYKKTRKKNDNLCFYEMIDDEILKNYEIIE